MHGRSCEFYADTADLHALLTSFRCLDCYKFVQMKSAVDRDNIIFEDPLDIMSMAIVSAESPTRSVSFIVIEKLEEVVYRHIELNSGGTRIIADQNQNHDSVVFALGGEAGEETLIMSDINTSGETPKAVTIHKDFKRIVRASSAKLGSGAKSGHLMPGAMEKLRLGWRLARDKGWARETDFNPFA